MGHLLKERIFINNYSLDHNYETVIERREAWEIERDRGERQA